MNRIVWKIILAGEHGKSPSISDGEIGITYQ